MWIKSSRVLSVLLYCTVAVWTMTRHMTLVAPKKRFPRRIKVLRFMNPLMDAKENQRFLSQIMICITSYNKPWPKLFVIHSDVYINLSVMSRFFRFWQTNLVRQHLSLVLSRLQVTTENGQDLSDTISIIFLHKPQNYILPEFTLLLIKGRLH